MAIGDPAAVGEDKLDEAALRDVASATGGGFFRAMDRAGLADIYRRLDSDRNARGGHRLGAAAHRPVLVAARGDAGADAWRPGVPPRPPASRQPERVRGPVAVSAFHFLRPFWLLALLPAVLLWWAFRRQSDVARRWRAAIDPGAAAAFRRGSRSGGWLRPGDALLAAWVIGAVAVAGPAWQREPSPFAADAPPVMLVLRVTPSMQASDLPPSRLERAKEKIADLLALQPRTGVRPDRLCRLGASRASADARCGRGQDMAQALSPDIMPKQGDALAEAVALARKVLADGGEGGSILLLADEADPSQSAAGCARGASTARRLRCSRCCRHGRSPGAGLREAATALGADIEIASGRYRDVAALARHALPIGSAAVARPGETEHWRDAGWYLVPVLAVVVLLWFRRGWVVLG